MFYRSKLILIFDKIHNQMKHIAIFGISNNIDEHIKQIRKNDNLSLSGIFANNTIMAKKIAKQHNIKFFTHPIDAIATNDIIDFAAPHILDLENAILAIKNNKNLLLECDFLKNISRAEKLIKLNYEANVDVFISQPDKSTSIIKTVQQHSYNPSFMEIRRGLTHGCDTDLISILLSEITLAMNFIKAKCKRVSVKSNASNIHESTLINARLEFDNSSVLSININTIAVKERREASIFENDGMIFFDMINQEIKITDKKGIIKENTNYTNTIDHCYLETSLEAIVDNTNNHNQTTNLYEAYEALKILHKIEHKLYAS